MSRPKCPECGCEGDLVDKNVYRCGAAPFYQFIVEIDETAGKAKKDKFGNVKHSYTVKHFGGSHE